MQILKIDKSVSLFVIAQLYLKPNSFQSFLFLVVDNFGVLHDPAGNDLLGGRDPLPQGHLHGDLPARQRRNPQPLRLVHVAR